MKKLSLNVEKLKTLTPEQTSDVAGGGLISNLLCTLACQETSAGKPTYNCAG